VSTPRAYAPFAENWAAFEVGGTFPYVPASARVLASLFTLLALASLTGCERVSALSKGGQKEEKTATPAPVTEPSAIQIGPPAPPPNAKPIRVLVGGDLLPHRPSLVAPASIGVALAPLASTFATADAVIANYEAATGDVDPKAFRLAYAAPRGWLEALPPAGIKAVTVANNHACDLGIEGVDATLDGAQAAGLVAIGGDAKDPWTPRVVAERGGKRICAVGWTTLFNAEGGCRKTAKLAYAPLDRRGKYKIDAALSRARSWCDATIAILHGGVEYVPQTSLVMDQAGHAAEAGADAIVVHHPHIASPVVIHPTKDGRNVPIFASVGNLVTNQGESWKPPMFPVLRDNRRLVCVNGWTRLGVLADFAFSFDNDTTKLDWGFHLLWIENQHADDRTIAVPKIEARLLDPERDKAIVARLSEDRKGPVALFDDGCWVEKPVYTQSDVAKDPRCSIANRKAGPPAPAPVARAKKKPKGR
jgi:hypothetical protein